MIWYYLLTFIDKFFSSVFRVLGVPQIETLPLGMDEALTTAFGYFNEFMSLYPPIAIIFKAVMFYLGFKVILLILKNIPIVRVST